MADREFVPAHNSIVNLDTEAPGADQVADILTFLSRSRISYAISASPALNLEVLRDFWTDISYDTSVHPHVIRTTVGNQPIAFSSFQLRRTLRLGTTEDDSGAFEFTEEFIAGALSRMGYTGSRRGRFFTKTCVFGQWRFLWHVMATVFAPRKSGYDELSPTLLSAMLSFVYNKQMAFTQHLFSSFVGQVTGSVKSRFLLYPRFTMLLIRDLLPDFPEVQPTLFVNVLGLRAFNVCFMYKDKKSDEPRPVEQPLFGAVVNPAYEAPPENDWKEREPFVLFIGQAPEAVNPEVARLEGRQEQDDEPSEDSSQGLKLLMNVALKGKRKVSEVQSDKSLITSGRRTRSASRQLLIRDVSQDEPQVETDQPQEEEQVPIPAEKDTCTASACTESIPTTEPCSSSVPPPSSSATPKRKRKTSNMDFKLNLKTNVRRMSRINRLESKVRKLTRFANYMSKEFAAVNVWANMQNKAYCVTVETTHQLLDAFDKKQDQIDSLKRQVRNLRMSMSSQGGVSSTQKEADKTKYETVAKPSEESDDELKVCEMPGPSEYIDPVRTSKRRKTSD